jgi:hypothetical protein
MQRRDRPISRRRHPAWVTRLSKTSTMSGVTTEMHVPLAATFSVFDKKRKSYSVRNLNQSLVRLIFMSQSK